MPSALAQDGLKITQKLSLLTLCFTIMPTSAVKKLLARVEKWSTEALSIFYNSSYKL